MSEKLKQSEWPGWVVRKVNEMEDLDFSKQSCYVFKGKNFTYSVSGSGKASEPRTIKSIRRERRWR